MTEAAAAPGLVELLRIAGALVLVLALALAAGVLLRRGGFRAGGRGSLRVEERLSVGRGVQLAVVACGARRLLVGITDKRVELVAELDEEELALPAGEPEDDRPAPDGFAARLATAISRGAVQRRSA